MSSLFVFRRPSNNQLDGLQQTGQPERGDVVDIQEDDLFDWGNAVRTIGWWQVIVVPNAGLRELGALTKGSKDERKYARTVWRHRIWSLNLDALGEGQLSDGVWVVPLERLLSHAAIKVQTREVADIGDPQFVIG